jgi:hypothetical protein
MFTFSICCSCCCLTGVGSDVWGGTAGVHHRLGHQVGQPPHAQAVQLCGHGRDGSRDQRGDMTQVEPLVAQLNGGLQVLRIELPRWGRRTLRRSTRADAPLAR